MLTRYAVSALLAASTLVAANSAFANDSSLTTGHWLASDVYHAGVYDPKDNKIGNVDDLIIKQDGSISKAVIGVGGFLGVGTKDVAVQFANLRVKTKDDKSWLVLDTTKDQLKAAPAFDKSAFNK